MVMSDAFWLWPGNPKAVWALLCDGMPLSRTEMAPALEIYLISGQELLVEYSLPSVRPVP